MAHKVILIHPERFSESQIDEIDRANLYRPESALAERNRPIIEETLTDQHPLFPSADAIRADVAKRMRRVLSRLGITKEEVRSAIGSETVGESTSWAELNDLLIQLLVHLTHRRLKPLYEEDCDSSIAPNPTELLMKCGTLTHGFAELDESYDELAELMGFPKGGYQTMIDLINKGMETENATPNTKSGNKLGRDPFKP